MPPEERTTHPLPSVARRGHSAAPSRTACVGNDVQ